MSLWSADPLAGTPTKRAEQTAQRAPARHTPLPPSIQPVGEAPEELADPYAAYAEESDILAIRSAAIVSSTLCLCAAAWFGLSWLLKHRPAQAGPAVALILSLLGGAMLVRLARRHNGLPPAQAVITLCCASAALACALALALGR